MMDALLQVIDEAEGFYPTPNELIAKMVRDIDWYMVENILEPSAGKGNIVDYIKEEIKKLYHRGSDMDIDCIEIDPNLQYILHGKGHRVVGDDFLGFKTYKRYGLIIMNPPFADGDKHLLKAIEMQENGGAIICLLNAETIRNPYTNTRKLLQAKLNEHGAQIQFLTGAFSAAERKTQVDVALVRMDIPKKQQDNMFFGDLKKAREEVHVQQEAGALVIANFIKALVAQYNMEADATVRFIREFYAIKPYIMQDLDQKSNTSLLRLSLKDSGGRYGYNSADDVDINEYLKLLRLKYWRVLFKQKSFTKTLTKIQREWLEDSLREMGDYDFSEYNINEIYLKMSRERKEGINEAILWLFDKLSGDYSWYPETTKNVRYYNGWATNKAHKINKKVIIPTWGLFSNRLWTDYAFDKWRAYDVMSEIEKVMDYLDNGETPDIDLDNTLECASKEGITKKIECKYFRLTLYKKGTAHLEFKNLRLIDKLNIIGSQMKGWLPPCYGKSSYAEMNQEEQAVVNEFQGDEAYSKMMQDADYYLKIAEQEGQLLLR